MYNKVLVPLDLSKESEEVLPMLSDLLNPEGEAVLFHVTPPCKTIQSGQHVLLPSEQEEAARLKATAQLNAAISQKVESSSQCTSIVRVSKSVSTAIVDYAARENVDLILMYTHDRKGLAKLLKKSIAERVQRTARAEVRVFKPHELQPT